MYRLWVFMEALNYTDGHVWSERGKLYTRSFEPGKRIYGEHLAHPGNGEFREWSPRRSKLSAYLTNGGRFFPFSAYSNVLYLGASSGTTPSHVSDVVTKGKVVCVEFAPRMFRELVRNCEGRPNMIPVLGDATNPSGYKFTADSFDVAYCDVAQKNQADIIADNMDAFHIDIGMLAVKARSEDVTESPEKIFRNSERRLIERGFEIIDNRRLDPYEDSHAMICFKR